MKHILVIGGAGYIGSHMVNMLSLSGYKPIIFDNFSTGNRESIFHHELVEGDLNDPNCLKIAFNSYPIDAVMHFASFISIDESVALPLKYYYNNISSTITLLNAMKSHDVNKIIFSSSASVYGQPIDIPVSSSHPTNPINPYGRTKLMIENILTDCDSAHHLKSISLRYFNAAGAVPSAGLGERHAEETHLIPLVLQVASGRRKNITVYGQDYPTKDGTCIRDYIHVLDLCNAHLLALETLLNNGPSATYNLGTGQGHSVKEIIETAKKVTQKEISVIFATRRPADPAELVADASDARKNLGWKPSHSSIENILSDAWEWEKILLTDSSLQPKETSL